MSMLLPIASIPTADWRTQPEKYVTVRRDRPDPTDHLSHPAPQTSAERSTARRDVRHVLTQAFTGGEPRRHGVDECRPPTPLNIKTKTL